MLLDSFTGMTSNVYFLSHLQCLALFFQHFSGLGDYKQQLSLKTYQKKQHNLFCCQ